MLSSKCDKKDVNLQWFRYSSIVRCGRFGHFTHSVYVILFLMLLLAIFQVNAQTGSPNSNLSVGTVNVNSLRIWDAPDHTRIVFDLSEEANYSLTDHKTSGRLFVDIIEGVNLAEMPNLAVNPRLSAVRHGVLDNGSYRYAFDLKKHSTIENFKLMPNGIYGHRIVVDVFDKAISEAGGKEVHTSRNKLDQSVSQLPEQAIASQQPLTPVAKPSNDDSFNEPVIPQVVLKPRSQNLIVAIDAGHGGEDPGAVGWRKLREKDITLKISKKLQRLVNSHPGMEAHLVRTGDYYIRLRKRTKIARTKQADLFVSIHADAFGKKSANGLSVFALSERGASSEMARTLAKKENAADLIGGVSLKDKDNLLAHVLLDLSMTNTINEGVEFGKEVLSRLKRVGRLHSKRVEQAGFAVLKSPDIPSILVETGFITNPAEAKKLNTDSYQQSIAQAVYDGIKSYYKKNPIYHSETRWLVEQPGQASRITQPVDVDQVSRSAPKYETSPSAAKRFYTVKRGDVLSVIAKKNKITLRDLKLWNKIKGSRIYVGKKLKLFDPSGQIVSNEHVEQARAETQIYRVKRGDSVSVIAERFSMKQSALKSLNNLRGNRVYVGQKLKVAGDASSINSASKPSASKTVVRKNSPKNQRPQYHIVRSGDSWSSLSVEYNIKLSALKKRNNSRSNRLTIGDKLLISINNEGGRNKTAKLHKNNEQYRVKRGDTLSEIAEQHGTTMRELRRLNKLKNDRLYVGQKLKI